MQPSKMFSRYSIFNSRNLCEIAGFNPDGSPSQSNLRSVAAGPFSKQPASAEKRAIFNLEASGLAGQTVKS